MIDRLIPNGFVELRALPSKAMAVVKPKSKEFDEFVAGHYHENVFFGVAPRVKWNVPAPARCLWVDIDFKDRNPDAAVGELALFDLTPSYIVSSGGGLHCYWLLNEPIDGRELRWKLRWLAKELSADIKSAEPKRILRVPQTLNYKYDPARKVEVLESKGTVYEAWEFGNDASADIITIAREGPASPGAIAKARDYIAGRDGAVEGQGGDNWTYETVCVLIRDLGLGDQDALEMLEEWNKKCLPSWSRDELVDKIKHARRYGQNATGARDPAADFAEVVSEVGDAGEVAEEPVVAKSSDLRDVMNTMFAAVNENGKLRIYEEQFDESLSRPYWVRYQRRDFLEVCKSIHHFKDVVIGTKANGESKMVEAGVWWLDHYRKKPTYTGLTFMPGEPARTGGGRLNLWRGFAVEAVAGDWSLLKLLIYETLCQEDVESYEYVMDWMARAVQTPWDPGQVALVFKGRKGSGKSTLGRAFTKLFGRHGMIVASPSLLAGRFNAHLRDCAALFADEAFWAGDKSGEGILKSLVTEPIVAYEGKGENAVLGRNYIHLIMASNNEWVVPAGLEHERRFAVFEVADEARNKGWWDGLYKQLDCGGYSAMLYELLARDVTRFNVMAVPQTDALMEQRLYTMKPTERWLLWLVDRDWGGLLRPDGLILADKLYESCKDWFYDHDVKGYERRALETMVATTVQRLIGREYRAFKITLSDPVGRHRAYRLPGAADLLKVLEERLAGSDRSDS